MKIKVVIIVLAVAAVGLGIGLLTIKQQADKQHEADTSSILDFSNQVTRANQDIVSLRQDNLALTNNLATSQQQVGQLSNNLAAAKATLDDARTTLTSQIDGLNSKVADLNTHISGLNTHITGLNARIGDLETQNKALDERASELTNAIAQLNVIIEDTRAKLTAAKNDSAFLQSELQKQMAQKAELEHKFNDVDDLRIQLNKIKTELFIARRARLMKNDNGHKKGAELLMQHSVTVTSPDKAATMPNGAAKPATKYDLNVEVGSDGSVRAIPPLGTAAKPVGH